MQTTSDQQFAVPFRRLRIEITIAVMIRYGMTIFLSAFLLFQIQPMIARFILPWFGGTAAVWTTCMMFFQIVLLLGYLYVHLLRRSFSPRVVGVVHVVVIGLAAITVAVIPADTLRPTGEENLTIAIIRVLVLSIGLPFFVLSTTGPLVQAWQARTHSGQSPYRLYALSNLGSMLALLTYPFLVERFLPLADQAMVWTVGFYLFSVGCCWSGWQAFHCRDWAEESTAESTRDGRSEGDIRVGSGQRLVWSLLSMAASIVFLATTNLMCQEVASVPFLWILPLVLYLSSFIICFDRPQWYRRRIFIPFLAVAAFVSIGLLHLNVFAGLSLQIFGLSAVCFAAAMVCHGELERLKPPAEYLTSFYLWIAVGGALGGVFVCVVAPHWFTGFYEFHAGLLICLFVSLVALYRYSRRHSLSRQKRAAVWCTATGVFLAIAFIGGSLLYFLDPSNQPGLVFRGRNEYGLSAVVDQGDYRQFINGRIEHGGQSRVPGHEMDRIRYYVPGSGVGVAFESYRLDFQEPLKIGVIGLGAGAMATWMEPGDEMVFYEVNPMVKEIAETYFSFLSQSKGASTVILGDGRIQLQDQWNQSGSQQFDLLFMDAFSSDSIPVHLLTTECFDLYWAHLKPDGVLIAHITNRFIDLRPVILEHARRNGRHLVPILIDYRSEDGREDTRWVLLTRNRAVIESTLVGSAQTSWPENMQRVLWTDDYASFVPLLNWSASVNWGQLERERREHENTDTTAERSPSQ